MTEIEASERLRAFENRHRLFTYLYDDWSMWRVVRRLVHSQLVALPMPALHSGGNLPRIGRALMGTLKLARYLVTGHDADIVVKSFVSALREVQGDRFRDIYFDSLLDSGLSAFRLEGRNSVSFSPRSASALRPAHLDTVVFEFWTRILRSLPQSRVVTEFCANLEKLLDADLGIDVSADRLVKEVSSIRWQSALYKMLLRRLRPRAVLVADAAEYPLVVASHRLGIKLIELQHGIFDLGHPDAVPAGPDRDIATLVLPDILAVYGPYWKQRLSGAALPSHRIVAVGCDAIDRVRAGRQERATDRLEIVVTTQGIEREALVDWLLALVSAAPPGRDWQMTVKLHPGYDPSPTPYAALSAHPNVSVLPGDSSPSTQDLLVKADWHLSISSACHYDALSLGVPTAVIPLATHQTVSSIIDGRMAHLCATPGAFWAIVDSVDQRQTDPDYFCRAGFVTNMRELIQ